MNNRFYKIARVKIDIESMIANATEENRNVLLDQLDGYEKALDNAFERYKKATNLIDKIVELKYIQRSSRHIDEILRMLKNNEEG